MRYIEDRDEFKRELVYVGGIACAESMFPVSRDFFSECFASFRFMSFLSVFGKSFFKGLKDFCLTVGDDYFFMLVTDPDPLDYFRKFNRYNAICMSINDDPEMFLEFINAGPAGSSADSLLDGSNRLFFYSHSKKWVIISDRMSNLSYCGFVDDVVSNIFVEKYSNIFSSASDAAEFSMETAGFENSLSSFLRPRS